MMQWFLLSNRLHQRSHSLKAACSMFIDQDLASYIIMDKINPPSVKTVHYRDGSFNEIEGVSELGIFGVYLASSTTDELMMDEAVGSLLRYCSSLCRSLVLIPRTKSQNERDGGVASGVAVLDSPVLY